MNVSSTKPNWVRRAQAGVYKSLACGQLVSGSTAVLAGVGAVAVGAAYAAGAIGPDVMAAAASTGITTGKQIAVMGAAVSLTGFATLAGGSRTVDRLNIVEAEIEGAKEAEQLKLNIEGHVERSKDLIQEKSNNAPDPVSKKSWVKRAKDTMRNTFEVGVTGFKSMSSGISALGVTVLAATAAVTASKAMGIDLGMTGEAVVNAAMFGLAAAGTGATAAAISNLGYRVLGDPKSLGEQYYQEPRDDFMSRIKKEVANENSGKDNNLDKGNPDLQMA